MRPEHDNRTPAQEDSTCAPIGIHPRDPVCQVGRRLVDRAIDAIAVWFVALARRHHGGGTHLRSH
jgi:hypothetical protein